MKGMNSIAPPMPTPRSAEDMAFFEMNGTRYLVMGSTPKKYVYGLKGIQELFNCSKSTAYNIKRSGRIDAAISQIGNTIIVDAEKALELLKK